MADEHGGIRRSNSRRTERRTGRPARQPGLVISLGFGGLHPGLTGLLQIQPGDAPHCCFSPDWLPRSFWRTLVTRPFYVFYRRYVEALATEINLQAMRGTEHMGERDSIG
jgi:hypothetical protein